MCALCICAQLCLTLCNPLDDNLLGSSVHVLFQARILEWVINSFSGGSFRPGIEPTSVSPGLQAGSLVPSGKSISINRKTQLHSFKC